MNPSNHERGRTDVKQAAAIHREACLGEIARASGEYTATLVGPCKNYRDQYAELKRELLELAALPESARRGILKGGITVNARIWEIETEMAKMLELKWVDRYTNIVTTVGKNDALDKHLAGSSYTAAWYLGLIDDSPSFNAADTSASHSGWTEFTEYDEANRVSASWSAAAAGSKALSAPAQFTINQDSSVIAGTFLIADNTKGGSTGVLYSAGAFTGGDKAADDNDTLNVSYTASLT